MAKRERERLDHTFILNPRPQDGTERGVSADGTPKPLWMNDGLGLYLINDNNGSRWFYRFRWRGKLEGIGLGSAYAKTMNDAKKALKEARGAATEARALVKKGVHPGQAKEQARKALELKPTFAEFAESFLEFKAPEWTADKTRQRHKLALTVHAKSLANMPVDAINVKDIENVLEPIWREKYVTAKRIRESLEMFFDYAKAKGLRSGDNPAAWRGNLKGLLPTIKHIPKRHASLDWRDIPEFMSKLRQRTEFAAPLLEFAILCGNRISEANGATWDEINLIDRVWTIPAARHKSRKDVSIPLCKRAIELLEASKDFFSKGVVFPGTRGQRQTTNATYTLAKSVAGKAITQHGMRGTFKTWAMNSHGADWETSERALSHAIGNKVSRSYYSGPEFTAYRALLEAWEAYCSGREA